MTPKRNPKIKMNPLAGLMPKFEYSFPEGFVLVVDSNEQLPLFTRPPVGLLQVREHLETGDYSVRGFTNEVSIERKSVVDLQNSLLGKERDRELSKMIRLSQYERKWLVVEGSEVEVLSFPEFGDRHPNRMRGTLVSIEVKLGIPIHYAGCREYAERYIVDRLIRYYRWKREGK